MISILGAKRIFWLVFLVGVNILFAGAIYFHFQPQSTLLDKQLARAEARVSSTRADIQKLRIEFDQLEEQQAFFDKLKEEGFFGSQSRRRAKDIFEDVQAQSKVVSAVASVKGAKIEENEEAREADHSVLVSPVQVQLEAMDDMDIYRYLNMLMERFPGHIMIDNVKMRRLSDVSNPVLRSIASGKNVPMVEGSFSMSWRTMLPENEVTELIQQQPGRGRR